MWIFLSKNDQPYRYHGVLGQGYYADGLSRISSTPTKELAAKKARISLEDDGLVIYTKSNLNLGRGLRISLS